MKSSSARSILQQRGVTLIELMVVLAIIGILAAIGGMSYVKYIKRGKTAQLKQYALEIEKAQKEFASRNGTYFDPEDSKSTYSENSDHWKNVLGFSDKKVQETSIEITTDAGGSGSSCSFQGCPSDNFTSRWYAVQVSQNLDPSNPEKTIVYLDSQTPNPIVINEGK